MSPRNTTKVKNNLYPNYSEFIRKAYKEPEPPKMPRIPYAQQGFYYIICKSEGRIVLLGPYSDEASANTVAVEKLDGAYEVVQLRTRDRAKATQLLRHRILSDNSDLGQALRRMKHTL